jgi:hypothetical protein
MECAEEGWSRGAGCSFLRICSAPPTALDMSSCAPCITLVSLQSLGVGAERTADACVSSRIACGSPSQPPPETTPEFAQAYLSLFLFLRTHTPSVKYRVLYYLSYRGPISVSRKHRSNKLRTTESIPSETHAPAVRSAPSPLNKSHARVHSP